MTLKLSPDNFVPVHRTPWAGAGLIKAVKSRFLKPGDSNFKIGESWEFSSDALFPSTVTSAGEFCGKKLSDLGTFEILVKLISTGSPLSWQVHPADSHPALGATESGKPESWLILEAEPGAGVYIGLNRPWTRSDLKAALLTGSFSSSDLHFVPVRAGDFFDIAPGVPHALGPGLVIYEPQRVLVGRSGVTWRLWDWNRRYAKDGFSEDPQGTPRATHLDLGLSVISPEHQTGPLLASRALRHAVHSSTRPGVSIQSWAPNSHYGVHRILLESGKSIDLTLTNSYASAIVVKGEVQSTPLAKGSAGEHKNPTHSGHSTWTMGDTLLLGLGGASMRLTCSGPSGEILLTTPADAELVLA